MNLRKWEYFLKVAEFGNLSRVAEKLDISQPALSRQISALEEEIGVPLFIRTGRGLTLTPAGETFRARAETVMEEILRMPEEVALAASTPSGSLAFGAPPFMARILTGELCAGFAREYPKVRMRVRGAHSVHLREAIFFRDIDVGILAAPVTEPDIRTEPLLREQLFIVGPPGAGYEVNKPVSLASIADRPLILTPRPDGLRALVENGFAGIGRRTNVAMETEHAPMDELIRRGVGFTILPGCGMINSPLQNFSRAPIEGMTVTWLVGSLGTLRETLSIGRFKAKLRASVQLSTSDGRWQATYLPETSVF
ncbi:DNA-binding transcriptional regulator, LysR family [Ensifer adhaerens]|nr:DNA-binding transcriptional regulator, LysR family [Ensifer adhaerens]